MSFSVSALLLCNTCAHTQLCKPCFFTVLEDEVHTTIVSSNLFSPGERVAIAASGGKDSTVLAHMLTLLNQRHGYADSACPLLCDATDTGTLITRAHPRRRMMLARMCAFTHTNTYTCACACGHRYGLDLFLLSIDEGIAGYRDDSLATVRRNEDTYGIPLRVRQEILVLSASVMPAAAWRGDTSRITDADCCCSHQCTTGAVVPRALWLEHG
jgi:hypothetical protein